MGSHLLRRLLKEGYSVIGLKRSFSSNSRIADILQKAILYNIDETSLIDIFQKHSIEAVLHCATNYGRKDETPMKILDANLMLPLKLLMLALEYKTRYFFNTDTLLDKRTSNYSLSKQQFYEWLKMYSRKIIAINIKLEHFYGPRDDTSKFVTYFIQQLLNEVDDIKLTEGKQKRDFIYISDVVDALYAIIENRNNIQGNINEYEVGSGQNISIREFCELTRSITGNISTKMRFGAIPYREHELMESHVDLTALTALGWAPRIDLADGIRLTVEAERIASANKV